MLLNPKYSVYGPTGGRRFDKTDEKLHHCKTYCISAVNIQNE